MIRNIAYLTTLAVLAILVTTRLAFTAWPFTSAEDGPPTLAPLLAETTSAVVSVAVTSRPAPGRSPFNDPRFRRFFDLPGQPEMQPQPRRGVGSGVIVDAEEGIILSNHHVVANADEIQVMLSDRRQVEAEIIGSDAGTDIAVLEIDADGLTALPFGDSESLQVGDFVVAIGNPFGLGQTATSGIVSALGRTGINVEGYEDFIQTDASINPGNSGGALIDLNGELMGINTAIISPAGGNVGIGFAVPTAMAEDVMNQILEFGEVRRGRIGIGIQDMTPALAEAFGVDVESGAIITQVASGSSAEQAGLASGDVIVAVDGDPIENATELRNAIGLVRVGEQVDVTIVRDGDAQTLPVRIGEAPDAPQPAGGESQTPSRLEGAELANIPQAHPLFGEVEGVLVTRVAPGSPAAMSGLRPQDVITELNRRPVSSPTELTSRLDELGGSAALTVLREGRRLFVPLR